MNVGSGAIGGREVLEEASADDNERSAEWHTIIMMQWSVIVITTFDLPDRSNIIYNGIISFS